ncbi:MAG TPA: alpha/beta hydrolase [Bacteroidales bacterium]|jgi:proline iminopeptidase|nr:alpha/beta hydrolase [Bacteroidales bacterium]
MRTKILLFFVVISIFIRCKSHNSEILNIPGSIFQYTLEGNGPYIVTFTGSENLGRSLYSNRLRDHVTFIHADPQLMAASSLDTLTMNSVIDDIERVRLYLGVERISIMGHSMFGPVPLEYALKYPEHTKWSILSGALPFTTKLAFDLSRAYWDSSATLERKAIRDENLRHLLNDTVNKSISEKFWDQYKADVPMRFADPNFDMSGLEEAGRGSTNMAFVNRFWGVVLNNYDNSSKYQGINTPVLVISGKYDFGAPYFLWKDFGKNMPDYTFHIFEDAGHNPMLEVPDKFDQLLIDWISSHK